MFWYLPAFEENKTPFSVNNLNIIATKFILSVISIKWNSTLVGLDILKYFEHKQKRQWDNGLQKPTFSFKMQSSFGGTSHKSVQICSNELTQVTCTLLVSNDEIVVEW